MRVFQIAPSDIVPSEDCAKCGAPAEAWIWHFGPFDHVQQRCVTGHLYLKKDDGRRPEQQ